MITYYDHEPQVFEAVGNGSYKYRRDIKPITVQFEEEEHIQYECNEVIVWDNLDSGNILKAVIKDKWLLEDENKFINNYHLATLGILEEGEEGERYIEEYKAFLSEKHQLKEQIKADCETYKYRISRIVR